MDSQNEIKISQPKKSISKQVQLVIPPKNHRRQNQRKLTTESLKKTYQQHQSEKQIRYAKLKLSFLQTSQLKKVIKKMLFFLPTRRLQFLKTSKLQILEDLKDQCYDRDKEKVQQSELKQKIIKILNKICLFPTIQPHSKMKLIWDFTIIISILYFFFLIPLYIFVYNENNNLHFGAAFNTINAICLVLHIIDMPIKANAQYYKNWQLVSDRYKIFINYIQNWFLADILALVIIIFMLYIDSDYFRIAGLLYYVKIVVLNKKLENFEFYFVINRKVRGIIRLVLLQIANFFIIHVLTCIWVYMDERQKELNGDDYHTWISDFDPQNKKETYFLGLYFITATLTTVGYGDVSATNLTEQLLAILSMLIGGGIFAYSISLFGSLIMEMNVMSEEAKTKMNTISTFMKKKNISPVLQNDIREYLDYLNQNENFQNSSHEQEIIDELPQHLKLQLRSEVFKHAVRIFEKNFSQKFLDKLIDIIEEINFKPDQTIYDPEDSEISSLIFLNKGKAKIISKKNIGYEYKLQQGEVYGLVEFFNGGTPNSGVKSLQFSQILRIEKTKFVALLKQFPSDHQRFCQIRDEITINNDYSKLPICCFMCDRKHLLRQCGLVHFDKTSAVLKSMIQYKQSMKENQEQERYEMPPDYRDQLKFPTFKAINLVRYEEDYMMKCEQYQYDLQKYADENAMLDQKDILVKEDFDELAYHKFPKENIMLSSIHKQQEQQMNLLEQHLNAQQNKQKEHDQQNTSQLSIQHQQQQQQLIQFPSILHNNGSNVAISPTIIHNNKRQKSSQQVLLSDIELEEKQTPLTKQSYLIRNNDRQQLKKEHTNTLAMQLAKQHSKSSTNLQPQQSQQHQNQVSVICNESHIKTPTIPIQSKIYSPDIRKQQQQLKTRNRNTSSFNFKQNLMQLYQQQLDTVQHNMYQIGNKMMPIMIDQMDKKQDWNNYFPKFNYSKIQYKINDQVQKKLLRLVNTNRRKSQKYYSKLQLVSPQRSLSVPIKLQMSFSQLYQEYQQRIEEQKNKSNDARTPKMMQNVRNQRHFHNHHHHHHHHHNHQSKNNHLENQKEIQLKTKSSINEIGNKDISEYSQKKNINLFTMNPSKQSVNSKQSSHDNTNISSSSNNNIIFLQNVNKNNANYKN